MGFRAEFADRPVFVRFLTTHRRRVAPANAWHWNRHPSFAVYQLDLSQMERGLLSCAIALSVTGNCLVASRI